MAEHGTEPLRPAEVVVRRDAPFDRDAVRDLLDELFPFGLTTPDERREHETHAA